MRDPLSFLRRLSERPQAFDFYAALRQIECAFPQQPRIGQSVHPQDDPVRYGQNVSLAFESAMISSFSPTSTDGRWLLKLNFFGLCGANGPLPSHITEYARDRSRNSGDHTLLHFFDIFHHRMSGLLYRAWASAQPSVSFDRPGDDRFSAFVGSVYGGGSPSFQRRDAVPDLAKLHYAGLLSGQTRHAAGLVAILSDFFRLPVQLRQFVGHWSALPEDGLCRLASGPQAQVLGRSTVMGKRIWDCQHKFRIEIGPLDFPQFCRMLPGGDSAARLADWVKNYVGLSFDWDVNLVLKKDQRPPLALGKNSRLGWTSWLGTRAPAQDDRQLCYTPSQHAASQKT